MRDLLRFITCGSVDDGKSTLIGHLLYDSKLLYADQERALELESKVGSRGGDIDYSLLLDGLTEEREQGITIDVAYRYFTTDVRSFIVADTPGHEEYTRNMAVGTSIADLSIILLDATKGVLVRTKRHARICSIMGIRHFVFAINKMDLVDYSEDVYLQIEGDIRQLCEELSLAHVRIIPVSATEGDNVTRDSSVMTWYTGGNLLSYLENVDVKNKTEEKGFYLPVQRVCRPDRSFRGFQGQVESGQIRKGDKITVLPSGETACVKEILVGNEERDEAFSGQPVTVQLDREVDISRGCVIEKGADIQISDSVTATLIWMDDQPLINGGNYFVKAGTRLIPGVVAKILYKIDVNSGIFHKTNALEKNEIGVCKIEFTDRIAIDRFTEHKSMGELILIDRVSFMTSACGVVQWFDQESEKETGRINEKTRAAAMGQQAVTVLFAESEQISKQLLWEVEKQLILDGKYTYYLDADDLDDPSVLEAVRHLSRAGMVVLLLGKKDKIYRYRFGKEVQAILYAGEETDKVSLVSFVEKVSSYAYDLSREASYI